MFDWLNKKDLFKPLEYVVLTQVSHKLAPEARDLFQKQIAAVNKIQRHAKGKEVCLYRMAKGRPTFDPAIQFPIKMEEARLAKVSLQSTNGKQHYTADVLLVNGFLFSLHFNTTPQEFQKTSEIQAVSTDILLNPLVVENQTEISGTAQIPPALRGKYKVENLSLPLSDSTLKTVLKQNQDVEFPKEYLEILKYTNGCTLDGQISVLPFDKIRGVITEEANYVAITEKEGQGVLALERTDKNGIIFLLPFDGGSRSDMGKSFIGAIEGLSRLQATK